MTEEPKHPKDLSELAEMSKELGQEICDLINANRTPIAGVCYALTVILCAGIKGTAEKDHDLAETLKRATLKQIEEVKTSRSRFDFEPSDN